MKQTSWNRKEREEVQCFAIQRIGAGRIPKEDYEILALELNKKYHNEENIRKYPALQSIISLMKMQLQNGEEPTGLKKYKPVKPKHEINPVTKPTEYLLKRDIPEKRTSSEKLNRLIIYANEIEHKTKAFCMAVREFAGEFEDDRDRMKKLTKVREAVEEYHKPTI